MIEPSSSRDSGATATTRLLIIQPWVPMYRVPFFDRLDARLSEVGVDLLVAHGIASPSIAARRDAGTGTWAKEIPTRWGRLGGRDVVRRRIGPTLKEFSPDLVVVEQTLHSTETMRLLAGHALGRYGLATWGHGRTYSSPQSSAVAAAKQWLTQQGDWFFAYTKEGADYVVNRGFPRTRVSVLNNTLDTDRLRADLNAIKPADVDHFRRSHGLEPGKTALYLGGVDESKGIAFLIESARIAAHQMPGFSLLIAGEGDATRDVCDAEAAGAPIRSIGHVEDESKALALQAADVVAIPELVGLAAIDALVAGRPVVTTDFEFHGPERDYLVPDETAVVSTHTPSDYATCLTETLGSPERLARLQESAREESHRHDLGSMVGAFVEGTLAWRDLWFAGLVSHSGRVKATPRPRAVGNSGSRCVAVLMTCHNRREQTVRCLDALRVQKGTDAGLHVYVTDDGSTDGTAAAIAEIDIPTEVIKGTGDLYWAAGMALAERAAMQDDPDFLLWLNDDVTLDPDAIARLLEVHETSPDAIVVGTLRDPSTGATAYGGRILIGRHPQRFSAAPDSDQVLRVDAFNGNAVLIPHRVRDLVGPIDGRFAHAYADDDYSMRARGLGVPVLTTPSAVGTCPPNLMRLAPTGRGVWKDLQHPKGRPLRSQVRYLRRHGGLRWPLYLAWGYVRALLRIGRGKLASKREQ